MFRPESNGFSEERFAPTRMSFGGHLEELRLRLWKAVIGFALIFVFVFILDAIGYATNTGIGIARPLMGFIEQPVRQELQNYYDRLRAKRMAQLADELRIVQIELDVGEMAGGEPAGRYRRVNARISPAVWWDAFDQTRRSLDEPASLRTFSLTEAMMVYFKVAMVCGVVLGSPWIFWQLWAFVAAGLYPQEKRMVHIHLPFSLGLFLAGVIFCQLAVMPRAIEALLWFNEWLGLQPDLRLSEWLGFAVLMPVVFGVAFQTPLVMRLVERMGVATVDDYRRNRRFAWFVMAVVAALITPSVDALSLLFLWVPMGLLYELGIVLCRLSPAPVDAEELAEV